MFKRKRPLDERAVQRGQRRVFLRAKILHGGTLSPAEYQEAKGLFPRIQIRPSVVEVQSAFRGFEDEPPIE